MTPEQAADRRVDSLLLQWQFAKHPRRQALLGKMLTRAIQERNALRSPERVEEIERERGLR